MGFSVGMFRVVIMLCVSGSGCFIFFKRNTAYELRISDWSSDVCSSDLHPHIHMIVPGGGISRDGTRWISARPAFLLPVRVLGALFRRLFLTRLRALHDRGQLAFFGTMSHLAERRAFLRHLSPVRKKRRVRSAERRVGTEGVGSCRSGWPPYI